MNTIETTYCNVLSGVADMFFENGIEPGTRGKCTVFDSLAEYYITPEGNGIIISGDNVNGRWVIADDLLLPPCGPFSGEIPDGQNFTTSCSNSLVRCDNLSFFNNGTFSETVSGKTTSGVYVRKGNLIALCNKNCLQAKVYVIFNHRLWGACHIESKKAHLLTEIADMAVEFASNAENISIPDISQSKTRTGTPKKEKSSTGTIVKMWFWLIMAFVGGFYFFTEGSLLLAAICFLICPTIAIITYIMGPSSLHKMVDDEAKKQYDKKINGGYTCPNCKHRAGYPISTVSKSMSIGAFGLASNKIGKSYKCENCGYMW